MSSLPVLVIGAGCTGLAIAQGLRKANIPCIVFERDESLEARSRDWHMGLHWAAPDLVSLLSVAEPFIEAAESQEEGIRAYLQQFQVDPSVPTKKDDEMGFLHGTEGTKMASFPLPNFYRLKRSSLREELSKGIDLRWNKKLRDLSFSTDEDGRKTVTAIFEDESRETGCLVVGAEGRRATVKNILIGSEASKVQRLPVSVTWAQTKYTREQALFMRSFHPLYVASAHPGNMMGFFGLQDVPDPDKPETWTFNWYISWANSLEKQDEEARALSPQERLKELQRRAALFTEPWKSAGELLHEGTTTWHFDIAVWDPSLPEHSWSNHDGRATMAGDAAHLMTFQRGQGLNQAVADAVSLVEQIKSFAASSVAEEDKKTQKEAIDAYEAEMKARVGEEMKVSILNSDMIHDRNKVLQSPVFTQGIRKSIQLKQEIET